MKPGNQFNHRVLFVMLPAGFGSAFVSANCSMLVSQYSLTSRRGFYLSLHTLMARNAVNYFKWFGAHTIEVQLIEDYFQKPLRLQS